MARTKLYDDWHDLKGPEYRLVDDSVKKIVTIEVLEYEQDVFDQQQCFDPRVWMKTEQGEWLSTRWVDTPQIIQAYSHTTYSPICKVFVRLWEEDAVFYTLKWK